MAAKWKTALMLVAGLVLFLSPAQAVSVIPEHAVGRVPVSQEGEPRTATLAPTAKSNASDAEKSEEEKNERINFIIYAVFYGASFLFTVIISVAYKGWKGFNWRLLPVLLLLAARAGSRFRGGGGSSGGGGATSKW